MNKSGVYKLNCNDWDAIYIEQTGRYFKKRHKEHEVSLRQLIRNQPTNPDSTSASASHLYSLDHSPSLTNPTPIHFETKGLRLGLLEFTEMKHALANDGNVINNQLDLNKKHNNRPLSIKAQTSIFPTYTKKSMIFQFSFIYPYVNRVYPT